MNISFSRHLYPPRSLTVVGGSVGVFDNMVLDILDMPNIASIGLIPGESWNIVPAGTFRLEKNPFLSVVNVSGVNHIETVMVSSCPSLERICILREWNRCSGLENLANDLQEAGN